MGTTLEDSEIFAPSWHESLRSAVAELSWLLSRDYRERSALKLVGDRHNLGQRQRKAVSLCSCSDQQLSVRSVRRVALAGIAGRPVAIDGFNALITVEIALGGGLVLLGRDRSVRDMAGVHGAYRSRGVITRAAVGLFAERLERLGAGPVTWYLDRPVSNSGALGRLLRREGDWRVELCPDPDALLAACEQLVVSSDRWILDRCAGWIDLVGELIRQIPSAWLLDLGALTATNSAA